MDDFKKMTPIYDPTKNFGSLEVEASEPANRYVVPAKPVNLEQPYAEYAEAFVEFVALKRKLKYAMEPECRDYLRCGLEKLGYSPEAIEYYAYQLDERLMDILDEFLDDYLTSGPDDGDDDYKQSPEESPGYDRWQELRYQLPELKKNLKCN